MIRTRVTTKGGDRLKRHLAEQRRATRGVDGTEIGIGFKGNIAGLAATHELGNPAANIPERPVMRPASRKDGAMTRMLRQMTRRVRGVPSKGELREAARAGAEGLRSAYLSASGTVRPVGATQEARKRGTPGAGRPLVGTRGPRMIDYVSGFVDGQEVE